MSKPTLIAFTGSRFVGKSTISEEMYATHDVIKGHIFNPGKSMVMAYLNYIGVPLDIAYRMCYTDLKDTPSKYLPNNSTCRYFMEELGFFMGTHLGAAWTLGAELKKVSQYNYHIVALESLVYEYDYFREQGGIVIRVERDSPEANSIKGERSDAVQATIPHDILFTNDAPDVAELRAMVPYLLDKVKNFDRKDAPLHLNYSGFLNWNLYQNNKMTHRFTGRNGENINIDYSFKHGTDTTYSPMYGADGGDAPEVDIKSVTTDDGEIYEATTEELEKWEAKIIEEDSAEPYEDDYTDFDFR